MRICIVYDCLYPCTVGGAERWARNLAERLAADGHEVTYLTLRQWDRGEPPELDRNVRVVTVGPRMALYTGRRRRILPPLLFGLGVLFHLARRRRAYDIVHLSAWPFFAPLAARIALLGTSTPIGIDWHEVWSRSYWQEYLGRAGGVVGYAVQLLCVRVPQRAFCFSRLHAGRLRQEGLRGEATVLEGEYAGSLATPSVAAPEPLVVFAGRLIPEKRAPLAVMAFALAASRIEGLHGEFYGDGPEREALLRAIEEQGAGDIAIAPGFVEASRIDAALRRALCMLSTSRREGYGMVVVEAAARGTPSIVVAGEDNAATELIEEGVNGLVAQSSDPAEIADAIVRVHQAGMALRESTVAWFAVNAQRLSIESSLHTVLESYRNSDRDSPLGAGARV